MGIGLSLVYKSNVAPNKVAAAAYNPWGYSTSYGYGYRSCALAPATYGAAYGATYGAAYGALPAAYGALPYTGYAGYY